jgi:hypothetical protein
MSNHLPRALRGRDLELPRVLPVAEAADLGMSRSARAHAIKTRGWQLLTRGVLLTVPEAPTRSDWLNVGLALAGPTGAISGWDAVRITDLGEPEPPRPEVLVLTRTGRNRVIGNVRIRVTTRPYRAWTLPADHPELAFAPIVHAARAVTDTALQYRRLAPVRALVTSAVQKRRCSAAELIAELDDGPRNHSGFLRRAIEDVLAGALSIAEAETIDVLRHAALPAFEANVPIVTQSGVVLAVADALWRDLRAVLEVDGRRHHTGVDRRTGKDKWEKTIDRHSLLTRCGLSVDHCYPSKVRTDPRRWVAGVEQRLRVRAHELGVPYRPVRDPLRLPADPGNPTPFVVPDPLP